MLATCYFPKVLRTQLTSILVVTTTSQYIYPWPAKYCGLRAECEAILPNIKNVKAKCVGTFNASNQDFTSVGLYDRVADFA